MTNKKHLVKPSRESLTTPTKLLKSRSSIVDSRVRSAWLSTRLLPLQWRWLTNEHPLGSTEPATSLSFPRLPIVTALSQLQRHPASANDLVPPPLSATP
jgi:hypothetical protein